MGMFQLMHSHFIFLDSVKAILVHCAHRLLSESTLILCTGTRPVEGKRPYDFPGIAKFPEPIVFPIRTAIPNQPENRMSGTVDICPSRPWRVQEHQHDLFRHGQPWRLSAPRLTLMRSQPSRITAWRLVVLLEIAARAFAQAKFAFWIQAAMSSALFRSTTRIESCDVSADSQVVLLFWTLHALFKSRASK